MDAGNKRSRGYFLTGMVLAVTLAAAQSCAPRHLSRGPRPAPQGPAVITPLPTPGDSQLPPAPEPPPVLETTRKLLPPDSQIKEQDLPTKGASTGLILKDWPLPPSTTEKSARPELPPPGPLPDDSSLLAKITPGTSPQRAVALRLTEEGRKLLEAGDASRALARLERSIAIDSSNGYAYYYLARAHHKLGRQKESLNFLDVAEARLAGEPFWLAEVHALRGENFRALGMNDRAEASFNKALSINSGNRTASEAMTRVPNDPAAGSR